MNTTITNINIIAGEYIFPYMIEYIKGNDIKNFQYSHMNDQIHFRTELVRNINTWSVMSDMDYKHLNGVESIIRIYFPDHSVESFKKNAKYILDIYTYIGSSKIVLGSVLLNRTNTLAVPSVLYNQNIGYYECIDIPILDPYDLIYKDDYHDFRKSIKNEDLNNDCSLLYCSLHVVEQGESGWIPDSEYNGGINILHLPSEEYLNYKIMWEDHKIKCSINFNEVYQSNFKEYLAETYQLNSDNINITYMLTINGLVKWIEKNINDIYCEFDKSVIKDEFKLFESWDSWYDGMSFMSTVIISTEIEGEIINRIILKSNNIPITQELFSKLLVPETYNIDINNYFDEDMNINIINAIQQSTTSYDIPDNSKSNIIVPIFYKVHDLGSIVIHPEVSENICINLDAYKSKVDAFILQIENVKFNELGTTTSGTIFKIVGPSLPQKRTNGTYYILSQDGDLITTGKYIYEL